LSQGLVSSRAKKRCTGGKSGAGTQKLSGVEKHRCRWKRIDEFTAEKGFLNRGIVQERQSLQCKGLEESIEFAAAMRVGGGTSGSIIVVTPPSIVHREQRLARARKLCANGLAEE